MLDVKKQRLNVAREEVKFDLLTKTSCLHWNDIVIFNESSCWLALIFKIKMLCFLFSVVGNQMRED